MDFLYCFDENYAKVASVSIFSLIKNNEKVRIHAFITDVTKETQVALKNWLSNYGVSISFYETEDLLKDYASIFLHRKINVGTFGRLLASSVLPNEINRIIYLDCDTLIVGNLEELSDLSMGDSLLAGVYDMAMPPVGAKENLGYKKDDIYINAGVLVMDMQTWRKENVEESFLSFCREHPDTLFFDQDALNAVGHGRIKLLPPNYNLTFITSELPYNCAVKLLEPYTTKYYSEEVYCDAQKEPKIIHFATEIFGKPWYDPSYIRFADIWREYYNLTPWKSFPIAKRKYSRTKLIGIYKQICERVILIFYRQKKYDTVSRLYHLLYQRTHMIQRALRRIRC